MAFGFPAYYKKKLKRSEINNIREKLEAAMAELPFTLKQKNEDRFVLKVAWSIWSWGEEMIIDFSKP